MRIIQDTASLDAHDGAAVCVLAEPDQQQLIRRAAELGGLEVPETGREHRRPRILATAQQVSLVLLTLQDGHRHLPLHVLCRGPVLLLIGQRQALEAVRGAADAAADQGAAGITAVVDAVARHAEQALEEIDDATQDLGDEALGFASAARRRQMGRLRAQLFRTGEVQSAHKSLLTAHDDLADAVGQEHGRRLAQAAATFGANQSTATRLYAMVGDVLNEQDTVVSERLTLVATIFLPLTLATGFFGMNFQWMLDRMQSLQAFLLLGLLAPAVLTVLTALGIRLLARRT